MPYPFPRSASDLIIPNEFKNTFRGEPFAVADILSESGERTIIFASRRNLNYLSQIHATNFTPTIPCVYALMQRKIKVAYDTVWDRFLRMINLNCNPAMCDFELASINSFNQQNPLCELTG
ncbi:hypothetical protein HZS_6227 [Henneguya salminicola]|nr:hypothetical protein HZS_6227 [Henneguya salminicola]